jgi:DnaK suppressor protein
MEDRCGFEMTGAQIADYRQMLLDIQTDLEDQDDLGKDSQQTVTLDQQSVGRLSRMDAIQQQAMAKATQTRRNQMKTRIKAALARMDEGEFGYCIDCGEEIPAKRLELDPTVPLCISCTKG